MQRFEGVLDRLPKGHVFNGKLDVLDETGRPLFDELLFGRGPPTYALRWPSRGWRVLISLLRPGGKMRIGLYSQAARGVIVAARARIASRGYRATDEDMRTCRQDIIREAQCWKMLIGARDFYSMSGCRDLLFNVMVHRFTIPEIAAFLQENDLPFLGFELFEDRSVIGKFQRQF